MYSSSSQLGLVRSIAGERLRLLGVLTGGHFVIHWFQQLYPVVLPSIKAGLGLNDVQAGALSSARQFAMGTMQLPAGILADSMLRHRGAILASAVVSMGAAYLLLGALPAFGWALVGSWLVGLGTALWHPAAAAALSGRFPEQRATALSIHGVGATISDTITPLCIGFLLVLLPWHTLLELQILPGLLMGLLIWRALAGLFSDAGSASWRAADLREVAGMMRNPIFLRISGATGILQIGRLVVQTFLPIYLQEHLGYSPFWVGLNYALLHVMGIPAQPVLGVLSDRYGRSAVLCPSFIVLGALCALLMVAAPGIQLTLVIAAIGIFFYTLLNITDAAVMDVAGSRVQASSYGLTFLATQLIVIPTPMLAGYVTESYGIKSAFLLAGAFLLLGALVIVPKGMAPWRREMQG